MIGAFSAAKERSDAEPGSEIGQEADGITPLHQAPNLPHQLFSLPPSLPLFRSALLPLSPIPLPESEGRQVNLRGTSKPISTHSIGSILLLNTVS